MAALNKDAKIVLRDAGITPATWARANYMDSGTWSGDSCGCPDDRCKDGFHHYPDQECGCLRTRLESYVSGEGQFDGEAGYVIRDPLWAQVRQARRRAGQHSGKPLSELCRSVAALDELLNLAHDWDEKAKETRQQIAEDSDTLSAGFQSISATTHEAHATAIREAIARELTGVRDVTATQAGSDGPDLPEGETSA